MLYKKKGKPVPDTRGSDTKRAGHRMKILK